VAYLSPLLALRIDSEGRLLRSVNGGRDWTIVTGSALPARLEAREALHAIDAQLAFIGQQGHLLRSADGGLSWQRIDLPLLADETGVVVPGRIHTLDSRRLLATAERDLLLTTTDGGLSWSAQRTGTGLRLGRCSRWTSAALAGRQPKAILATTTAGAERLQSLQGRTAVSTPGRAHSRRAVSWTSPSRGSTR
jgi:hypothetical protein